MCLCLSAWHRTSTSISAMSDQESSSFWIAYGICTEQKPQGSNVITSLVCHRRHREKYFTRLACWSPCGGVKSVFREFQKWNKIFHKYWVLLLYRPSDFRTQHIYCNTLCWNSIHKIFISKVLYYNKLKTISSSIFWLFQASTNCSIVLLEMQYPGPPLPPESTGT
jgi:hypothetical protein